MRRLLFLIPLLFVLSNAEAAYLDLAWNPEANVAGYKVYLGTSSGNYTQFIDVGNVTTYQVENLTDGVVCYFALTAYNTAGAESNFSTEVSGTGVVSTLRNAPPVANAGPDQTVVEGVTVTLNGSNSTDPGGRIVSCQWTQTAGPSVTLSNPSAAKTTFVSPSVGQSGAPLTFQLTVTDNGGLKATDTCIVNVTWVDTPPVANAGPDQTVPGGAIVTLDGSSSTDADNGIASYLWTQTAGPSVTLSDPKAVQPTFPAPEVGRGGASLTFQLTVTDNGGLKATDTCIVNVTWVDAPPVANAGPDITVQSWTKVTLNGSNSTDADDGIAAYQWKQTGGTPVTLLNPTSAKPSFIAPRVGWGATVLTFRLTVTDKGGLQASDTVFVTVRRRF